MYTLYLSCYLNIFDDSKYSFAKLGLSRIAIRLAKVDHAVPYQFLANKHQCLPFVRKRDKTKNKETSKKSNQPLYGQLVTKLSK